MASEEATVIINAVRRLALSETDLSQTERQIAIQETVSCPTKRVLAVDLFSYFA